jgi:hypothetical protein
MTDSRMALGMDRLPWLPDEPASPPVAVATPKPASAGRGLLGWAVAAILLVAMTAYWLGTRTANQSPIAPPSASVPLPIPGPSQLKDEVQPVLPQEAQPVRQPELHRVTDRVATVGRPAWRPLPREVPQDVADRVHRTIATEEADKVSGAQTGTPPKARPAAPVVPNTQNIRLWPARESGGAFGRVVQIGAFGSRQQAKLGWRYMSRAYPGVKRLPAVVVEARNSRGRPFYRFQIGTTSQAHSEVLCQRMERIRFSCAVVGLPGGKRAVER